jgi:hypothetical protein
MDEIIHFGEQNSLLLLENEKHRVWMTLRLRRNFCEKTAATMSGGYLIIES